MKKTTYNKLIREKLINLIEETGRNPVYMILDTQDYIKELKVKLIEKINLVYQAQMEANEEKKLEEFADLKELFLAISEILNIDLDEIEKIRLEKKKKKGGFEGRIYLKDIIEFDEPKAE